MTRRKTWRSQRAERGAAPPEAAAAGRNEASVAVNWSGQRDGAGGSRAVMEHSNVIPSLFLDFMQMQEFAKAPLVFVEGRGVRLQDHR